MSMEWQQGSIVKIIDETPNTRRFFVQVKDTNEFSFKPGQFVTLDLPIHEKKNKRLRSYSIASAPDGSNVFELLIVLVDDGLGTNYLFKNIVVGDELTFRGPAGVFILPDHIASHFFMICTGTGIAPFRSMLHYIHHHRITPTGKVYLIFGTRYQKDLLYHEDMKQLATQHDWFQYIPVLSREQWDGAMGYVHDVYLKLSKENNEAEFMLCGWKNMIDDARNFLSNAGFDKKQIHFESYG